MLPECNHGVPSSMTCDRCREDVETERLLASYKECRRTAEREALRGLRMFIVSKHPDVGGILKRIDDRLAELKSG